MESFFLFFFFWILDFSINTLKKLHSMNSTKESYYIHPRRSRSRTFHSRAQKPPSDLVLPTPSIRRRSDPPRSARRREAWAPPWSRRERRGAPTAAEAAAVTSTAGAPSTPPEPPEPEHTPSWNTLPCSSCPPPPHDHDPPSHRRQWWVPVPDSGHRTEIQRIKEPNKRRIAEEDESAKSRRRYWEAMGESACWFGLGGEKER